MRLRHGRSLVAACAGIALAPAVASARVDGAWSYFGNPHAVYDRGVTYFGFVSSRGDIAVAALSDRTGRVRTKVLSPRFGIDDHNAPSLWVRPDGRIVAFWSPHSGRVLPRTGSSRLRYRVSCAPRSIRCFGRTRVIAGNTGGNRLGYTYPSPVYTPSSRTLWLFWRGGDWQATYARSRDGGRTWTRPRTLVRGGRKVYAVHAADGADGFHVALNPDNPSVSRNSIYYLHHSRGRWRRADGSVVGALRSRVRMQRGDRVYRRGAYGSSNSWVFDVAQDAAGQPVVLYRLSNGPNYGYWYARWTGAAWAQSHITGSGRLHGRVNGRRLGASIGGATLDHEDPRVVYLSDVSGASAEIEVAFTPDGGRTWELHPVTSDSVWPNLRPVSPLGLEACCTVLWMHGWYQDYLRFDTGIGYWRGALPPPAG